VAVIRESGPYVASPLERLIAVNWGGLAVHFGAKDGPPVDPPVPVETPPGARQALRLARWAAGAKS
jgi:hypothetical protein